MLQQFTIFRCLLNPISAYEKKTCCLSLEDSFRNCKLHEILSVAYYCCQGLEYFFSSPQYIAQCNGKGSLWLCKNKKCQRRGSLHQMILEVLLPSHPQACRSWECCRIGVLCISVANLRNCKSMENGFGGLCPFPHRQSSSSQKPLLQLALIYTLACSPRGQGMSELRSLTPSHSLVVVPDQAHQWGSVGKL